jgi:vacuolar-type H+-ATPase subunit C/Vma6
MRRGWEDLVARVRGLRTHLLSRLQLSELARSPDIAHLARAIGESYAPEIAAVTGATAEQLEVAVRRVAARYVDILGRWSGDRNRALAPLLLDEDRRSVRALIRGAVAGSPPAERLAGLVPTPTLGESALEELARQPSAGRVAALLTVWGHPYGAPLITEAQAPQPDLLNLDLQLNETYARHAGRAVREAGAGDAVRRDLREYLQQTIDLENVSTALQLAAQRSSTDPGRFFTPGGRALERSAFLAAALASDPAAAKSALARALRETALVRVVAANDSFETAALRAELDRSAAAAREHPLGAAPVIAFLVRLRAEVRDLRSIIWRVASGAPPASGDTLLAPS